MKCTPKVSNFLGAPQYDGWSFFCKKLLINDKNILKIIDKR